MPANLPVVPACEQCNAGYSLDEEYVACLVACAVAGSTDPARIERAKIRRTLEERPSIRHRLEAARREEGGSTAFVPEGDRVERVMRKLGNAHVAYELSERAWSPPLHVSYAPLDVLEAAERGRFERAPPQKLFPEVGSRALYKAAARAVRSLGLSVPSEWIEVQPGRYRYLVVWDPRLMVRVVLSEYLAGEVVWE